MTIINTTKKVSDRLGKNTKAVLADDKTILGAWCAHIFYSGHHQYAMLTNERTLLTIVFPVKDLKKIEIVFPKNVDTVLQSYGLPSNVNEKVCSQLSIIHYARDTKRQVLGSMNDFIRMAKFLFDDIPNLSINELSIRLNDMPCSPIQMKSPKEAVMEILERVVA